MLLTQELRVRSRNLLLVCAVLPYSMITAREVFKSAVFMTTRCWDDEYDIAHRALSVIPMEERAKHVLLYTIPGARGLVVKEDIYSVAKYVYFDGSISNAIWEDRVYEELMNQQHDIRWYVTPGKPNSPVLKEYLNTRFEMVVSADTITRRNPQGDSFLEKVVPNSNFTPKILVYKRKTIQ